MSARRATPWWLFILAASFFAYFAVLLHLESRRLDSIGFRVIFSAESMTVEYVAPGSVAAQAGLRASDRIAAAAGRPIHARGDWHVVEANLSDGQAIPLVVERHGSWSTLSLTPRRAASTFWRTTPGIVLIVTRVTQLIALCIACMLIFRRPHDRYAHLGAWLLGSGAVFSIVLPLGFAAEWRRLPLVPGTLLWLPFVSSICVGGILFSFFAAFPRPLFTSKLLWAVAWTPLVLVVGPYLGAFASAVYRPGVQGDPLDQTLVLTGSALYEGAGLVVLALNYSRLHDVNERRRVRAIVPGSIAASAAGMLVAIKALGHGPVDMAVPLFQSPLLAVAALVMLALPVSFAYAILSRRMFDFATLLRAGMRYALARRVVLFLPVLLLAILAADVGAHSHLPVRELVTSRLAVYLPLAIVIAYAAFYRERWLTAIDRRFFRQRYDAEQILRGVVSDLRRNGGLESVAPSFVARLEQALHPTFAALMRYQAGGPSFETIASAPAGAAPAPLAARSKVVALARVLGTPLQFGLTDDEPLVRGLPPPERKMLSDARIGLLALVPAREGDREFLIVLGPKRSEEPYSSTDMDLIDGVADALSLAAGRAPQPAPPPPSLEECSVCGKCYDSGTVQCADDRHPLEPGRMTRVLADRYRLDRRIGEGGMSRLYAAVDVALQREVAVKVLREQWLSSRDSEARFRREARLAAGLNHPNIITIFDFGVSGQTAFLVMELLHGRSLRDELHARGRLPVPEVLGIVHTVGLAADAAHARGLIHRDLKPENVFLVGDPGGRGSIKVLDFGLAKSLGGDDGFSTGPVLMGTPHYMAPEQLRGEPPHPSWDTWALAVIAFELLSGSLPFVAPAGLPMVSVEGQAGQRQPSLLAPSASPILPGELSVLNPFFARALAIDIAERPESAAALVNAFESAAAGVRTD